MTQLFDVPNLDGLSIDPKDYREMERVLTALAEYCRNKGWAMKHRLEGDVNAALRIERHMEAIYDRLPEWARW